MIIKVIKGSDLTAAIRYNTLKVSNEQATVLSTHRLPVDDLTNVSLLEKLMTKISTPLKGFSSKVKNFVFHGVISPEEKDLSDDTLKRLSDDYMKEMGYEKQPYFVVKHQDTEHTHVHIVSVDIDNKGKKCIDDSFSYKKTSEVRKSLEHKYSLSSPQKSKQEAAKQKVENAINFVDKTSFLKNNVEGIDYKKNIQRVLRKVRKDYEFTDFAELNRVLYPFGIKSEVNSEHEGVSFYSIDKAGKQNGKAIAGSRFLYSFKTWADLFLQNFKVKESRKNQPNVSKKIVRMLTDQLFKKYAGKITYGDYIEQIRKRGIEAQPILNENGLLLGFNFVDHGKGCTYKASEVDKHLSKELKDRLIEGGVGESPEIRETNRLQKALEELLQIRIKETYGYESSAVKFLLYEKDLYISYCKKFYYANEYNTNFAIEKFIADKTAKLELIKEREEQQFQLEADRFLKMASVVDETKLAELLRSSHFNFEDGKLYDSRRERYSVETAIHFPSFDNYQRTSEDRALTKREIEFYTLVAEKGISQVKFDSFNLDDKLFRFLKPELRVQAQAKMMQDRFVSIAKTETASDVVYKSIMNGMLFGMQGNEVVIFSPTSEAKLVVTDQNIRNYFLSNRDAILNMNRDFLTKSGKASLLYQSIQKFNKVLESDFKKEERLIYICDWMAQHNPQIATDIRRMVEQEQYDKIISHLIKFADADLRFRNYELYKAHAEQKQSASNKRKGKGI